MPEVAEVDFATSIPLFLRQRGRLIYLIAATGVLYLASSHWAYDDPFISFRYARNLQMGLGFVYNPGERVLSTTSPLLVILLAILGSAWADLPHLANLVGAFSVAIGSLFLWDLGQTWRRPFVASTALLLYVTSPLLSSTLGSEMPLYVALCLGALLLYSRGRYHLVALFSSLAVLTRADAGVILLVLIAHYLIRRRRPFPWTALLLFASIVIPWFIFSWTYFGSAIPATLAAKQHQGTMAESQQFASGLLSLVEGYTSQGGYIAEALLLMLGIAAQLRYARGSGLLWVWAGLYFAAYTLLQVRSYFWYYATLVPAFVISVGFGIDALALWVNRIRSMGKRITEMRVTTPSVRGSDGKGSVQGWIALLGSLPIVLVLLLAIFQEWELWNHLQRSDNRSAIYQAIGEWLRENTPKDTTVATLEVGIIGYHAQRKMVDFAGLLQPSVAERLSNSTTFEDAAIWAVGHFSPHYLVLQEGIFPRLEENYAWQYCWPVQFFPSEEFHYSTNISVYFCPQNDPGARG